MFLGRRKQASWFRHSSRQGRENLKKCVVPPLWGTRMCQQVRTRSRLPTLPESPRRKKSKKPLIGYFCLLTTGGLISVRCFGGCAATHLKGTVPGHPFFCYPHEHTVGRRDRPRIGAMCPFVRLVSGGGDHITGDRPRPDPVWETACCFLPPASHGVPVSSPSPCGDYYDTL